LVEPRYRNYRRANGKWKKSILQTPWGSACTQIVSGALHEHNMRSRRDGGLAFALMSFIIAAVQAHRGCFSALGTPGNAGGPAGLPARPRRIW
jgi:hypothetical protein